MSIKAVFFDLDGTLLPMDQDEFVNIYFSGMAKHMAPYGYEPDKLVKAIWEGTGAMIKNDGSCLNEQRFWDHFSELFGRNCRVDEPVFEEFYRQGFQAAVSACQPDEAAGETIKAIKAMGLRVVLATNPIFPAIATMSRIRWAGLDAADFELITTYENSRHCKPNLDYYRDILAQTGLQPEDCLMVGNDVAEDMITKALGMKVFLLPRCLLNKNGEDISVYPQGGFKELLEYIKELAKE